MIPSEMQRSVGRGRVAKGPEAHLNPRQQGVFTW